MTKVDLVTGFLGAGKTTFLLDYARNLISRGERIGIIENDYGAINVDLLLLQQELGDRCRLEMVIGGDPDCHRRRLKTKLIAMGIDRYDRVLVEPSGIFDVDEFLDLLYEEPLERMLSPENVIAIVDAGATLLRTKAGGETDSEESRYILAEQLTKAGCVVLSKAEDLSEKETGQVTEYLNQCLTEVGCVRSLTSGDILVKQRNGFSEGDFERLLHAGSRDYAYVKKTYMTEGDFQSVFFFHAELPEEPVESLLQRIFADPGCGRLSRIKGFVRKSDETWLLINATREKVEVRECTVGQPVIIAIGESLDQKRIGSYWKTYENEYRG